MITRTENYNGEPLEEQVLCEGGTDRGEAENLKAWVEGYFDNHQVNRWSV